MPKFHSALEALRARSGTQSIDDSARELGFLDSVEEIDEKKPSLFNRFFSHTPAINRERLNSDTIWQNRETVYFSAGGGRFC